MLSGWAAGHRFRPRRRIGRRRKRRGRPSCRRLLERLRVIMRSLGLLVSAKQKPLRRSKKKAWLHVIMVTTLQRQLFFQPASSGRPLSTHTGKRACRHSMILRKFASRIKVQRQDIADPAAPHNSTSECWTRLIVFGFRQAWNLSTHRSLPLPSADDLHLAKTPDLRMLLTKQETACSVLRG